MTGLAHKKKTKRKLSITKDTTSKTGPGRDTGESTTIESGTQKKVRAEGTEPTPSSPTLTRVPDPLSTEPMTDVQIPVVVATPPKTLDELYMGTGSLDTILPDSGWPELAAKLKAVYTKGKGPTEEILEPLCTIYLKQGKPTQYLTLKAGRRTDQIPNVVAFLESFMKANGQWDYIQKQDWFKSDGHVIGIDVNYYANRRGAGDLPEFHKDTGGNNLFVNLVFDNEADIEATEWFADVDDPSKERQGWQSRLLPKSHMTDLALARKTLGAKLGPTGKTDPVAGGSVGKHAYVSWVDDLVWHATPTDKARIEFTSKAATASYLALDKSVDGDFQYTSKELGGDILGYEVISTMAETPGPHLKNWLAKNSMLPQDIDFHHAQQIWKDLYGGGGDDALRRYIKDMTVRRSEPWRLTGKYTEAVAEDKRLRNTRSILEAPIGLSKRRRFNSLPSSQEGLAAVRAANKNKGRSFIRTWVRILKPTVTVDGIDLS
jgi:hypothetical protein